MSFKRIEPSSNLKKIIECYWFVEEQDPTVKKEKIIPDGFLEIIFHYGDPYRINIKKQWKKQSKSLLAGQIRKHFFLENVGTSGIFGIKLKPTAITHLFDLQMFQYTDAVVDLKKAVGSRMVDLEKQIRAAKDDSTMCTATEKYFNKLLEDVSFKENVVDAVINKTFEQQGMISVTELCLEFGVTERQLERLFRKYIGVSPKFYSRIIRFNNIFQLIRQKDSTWSDLAYWGGFYDQSHFIRNFKNFTGDEPTSYPFVEKTLANFFLKKK